MASEEEIHKTLPHDSGFVSITLLHCVSLYSCPIELANLNAITTLKKFGYPVGYSDHTTSVAAIPIAAVALGATIIEKHFTLDKSDKGPDHFMSLNPAELAQMIVSIRSIEKALGTGTKVISPQESEMISRVRKGPDGKQAGL
jgi:sialic acid synthase SpsE